MLHGLSKVKLPLWLAVLLVMAVYVVRSAVRGFDFRPDMPADAVALVLFAVVLGIVAYVRATYGEGTDSGIDDEDSPADDSEGSSAGRAS